MVLGLHQLCAYSLGAEKMHWKHLCSKSSTGKRKELLISINAHKLFSLPTPRTGRADHAQLRSDFSLDQVRSTWSRKGTAQAAWTTHLRRLIIGIGIKENSESMEVVLAAKDRTWNRAEERGRDRRGSEFALREF